MRGVLRTLAQCHKVGVLHRDVKPGNFLLLSHKDDAPLKAIGTWGVPSFYCRNVLRRLFEHVVFFELPVVFA